MERDAIRIARAFAAKTFDAPLTVVQAYPGVERDARDRDQKIWNVVFRRDGAPDDPAAEVWVIVEAASQRARHFQAL